MDHMVYAQAQAQATGALLSAQDVAELLSVPASWVYAEARAGRIPHVRIGRYRRFRRESIEEWVERLERGPVHASPAPVSGNNTALR